MKKMSHQKFVENVGMKKFVYGIDEKYVDQNKPVNGNVLDREGILQNLIFPLFSETKKLSEVHGQK